MTAWAETVELTEGLLKGKHVTLSGGASGILAFVVLKGAAAAPGYDHFLLGWRVGEPRPSMIEVEPQELASYLPPRTNPLEATILLAEAWTHLQERVLELLPQAVATHAQGKQ